jgi:hypothetical protein
MKDHEFRDIVETLGKKITAPSYLEAVKNCPDAGKCISETLSVKVGALKLPLFW